MVLVRRKAVVAVLGIFLVTILLWYPRGAVNEVATRTPVDHVNVAVGWTAPLEEQWGACVREGRPHSLPFVSGDGFRCMCDFRFDETTGGVIQPAIKGRQSRTVLVFVKGDMVSKWLAEWHPRIAPHVSTHGYIMLTHNSDASPPFDGLAQVFASASHLKLVFAQNVPPLIPPLALRIRPLPIGLENLRWKKQFPGAYAECGKGKVWDERTTKVLINFNPNTPERKLVVDALKDRPFVSVAAQKFGSHAEYLEQLGDSQFVISPPGGGLDCHRTWEALICGCIPLVREGVLTNETYSGLPVFSVKKWDDVKNFDDLKQSAKNFLGLRRTTQSPMYLMQHFVERFTRLSVQG